MRYLFLIAILFVFGCTSEDKESFILSDQTYIFEADKILDYDKYNISQKSFKDSDFIELDHTLRYTLSFSDGGKEVSFIDENISGYAEKAHLFQASYYLDKGLFAAGRLKIWKDGNVLNAELTQFGSGVPVLSAVRGHMVLAD